MVSYHENKNRSAYLHFTQFEISEITDYARFDNSRIGNEQVEVLTVHWVQPMQKNKCLETVD